MVDQWVMYHRVYKWKLIFSFLPRRCSVTDQRLWFTHCYKGCYEIRGPGEPVVGNIYLEPHTYLLEKLSGRIK